jgi:pullulanase
MELHKAGFKVILDVVYNHTYRTYDSNFNIIMPGYYYRNLEDGTFSDGSGCGNEIASERPMVRKFIIDSLKYWVNEYKVDGFRFDLMALIDIDTIEEVLSQLRQIKPDIFIYGEPWTGGPTTLQDNKKTTKGKQNNLSFALFNDDFRNAIKGDNDGEGAGFVQGNLDFKVHVETGIAGSIYYDDVHIGFAASPSETINYVNSHDNLILADKMSKVFPSVDNEGLKRFNKLAFSILFTSQGIPFIYAGNEFLRSKYMVHNSYNSPLSINGIDWSLKEKNLDFYNYFKDLIKLRKNYKEFTLESSKDIRNKLKFMDYPSACGTIAYTITMDEECKYLLVIHNANQHNCFISKTAIKKHIENNYNQVLDDINFMPVFNVEGFVENGEDFLNYYGIEIPYLSTLVYQVLGLK